jgi:hypothetical protein
MRRNFRSYFASCPYFFLVAPEFIPDVLDGRGTLQRAPIFFRSATLVGWHYRKPEGLPYRFIKILDLCFYFAIFLMEMLSLKTDG